MKTISTTLAGGAGTIYFVKKIGNRIERRGVLYFDDGVTGFNI